jgi:hypothetical protein
VLEEEEEEERSRFWKTLVVELESAQKVRKSANSDPIIAPSN